MIFLTLLVVLLPLFAIHHKYFWQPRTYSFNKDQRLIFSTVAFLACYTLPLLVYFASIHFRSLDTEILNGYVTSKEMKRHDCPYPGWYDHSDSFCTNENTREVVDHYDKVCDQNNKCHDEPVYKTQYSYDFPYEQKWYVYSTLSDYQIDRADRQGVSEPQRYTIVKKGDPVSVTHSFKNRLKLAGNNIVNPELVKADPTLLKLVPEYPYNIYDYYKIDRFVDINVKVPNARQFNDAISTVNANIGPTKQANLVVVVYEGSSEMREAIYSKWFGGKKNDIILILGIKDGLIDWTDGITFLNNRGNEFLVSEFMTLIGKPLQPELLLNEVQPIILHRFNRKPMESVTYLEDAYSPPISNVFSLFIGAICLSLIAFALVKFNRW